MTRVDVESIMDYLENWHKYDGYYMASCVFLLAPHTGSDSNPSMRITDKGYYCLTCGARGSLEKLYNHVSGRPVQVTKKVYNPSAFIWDRWIEQYGSIISTCTMAHNQLQDRPELGEYLYKRKLTQEQIKSGYLGFLGGYYIFPIRDYDGSIQGAVARASPTIQTKTNRYSASKNCPVKIYVPDWKSVMEAKEIFVCFGTLDAWSLQMAGYPAVTGISGQQFQAEYLDWCRKPIWIIPDKHEEKSAIHLQSRLGWRGRRLNIHWPDGTKDPNGIHVNYGLDTLKEKIEEVKVNIQYE